MSSCSSPTEPKTGSFLNVKGVIENVNGAATLVTFQSFVDGAPITSPVTGAPRRSDNINGFLIDNNIPRGSHTLEIRVLDQVGSPNTYRTHDLQVRLDTVLGDIIGRTTLPEVTQSLGTGQGIIYQFSI
jgi:hypothetical protein